MRHCTYVGLHVIPFITLVSKWDTRASAALLLAMILAMSFLFACLKQCSSADQLLGGNPLIQTRGVETLSTCSYWGVTLFHDLTRVNLVKS